MKIVNNFHIPIILISILIALASNFGAIISMIEPFTFTNIRITNQGYVSMTSFKQTFLIDNQWWRLISPMFIHFSFAHLAFNCLWVYILGEKIEKINGSIIFILLVLISSIASNLSQFYWTSSNLFGGLSGVIYGLLGFCLIIEIVLSVEQSSINIFSILFNFSDLIKSSIKFWIIFSLLKHNTAHKKFFFIFFNN